MSPSLPPEPTPHSSLPAVFAAIITTMLFCAAIVWSAYNMGYLSLDTELAPEITDEFTPYASNDASADVPNDADRNGTPDDLDLIIRGLQEMSTTDATDVPLVTDESGNQTNISIAAKDAVSVREGMYSLTGRGSSQTSSYTGTVEIRHRQGATNLYDLTWRIGGGQEQWGVGILRNDVLSVGYYDQSGGAVRDAGVVSFVVSQSRLLGEWSSVQGGGAGYEDLKWLSQ